MTEAAAISAAPSVVSKTPSRARRIFHRVRRWTIGTFAVIGFSSVVRPFLFEVTPLVSGSMSPTLQGDGTSGDWVLAEKITYWFRAPRRFEIVKFHDSEGTQIMKRVVALPGETVAVKENRLQVNGQWMPPPAGTAVVKYFAYGNLGGSKPYPSGAGYYVLGDDSADSQDSRYEGSLTANRIEARAIFIVWPLSRMGWVR